MIRHRILILFAGAAAALAQDLVTLEQASSRSGPELSAAREGRTVTVRGQVASAPIWALGTSYLPLRDNSEHGLLLGGTREQFADIQPGDWVEATGSIQSRAALPLLIPASIHRVRHDAAPEPKELTIPELIGFRYLGLMAKTTGTVASISENLGGKSLEVTEHGSTIAVFLPRAVNAHAGELRRLRVGDRVRMTGLATQYSLEPPHDSGFQLLLASPDDVEILPSYSMLAPIVLLSAFTASVAAFGLWWLRGRRQGSQRRSMRAFHALSEEIISAASPVEIAEKLVSVLPTVTQATGVRLYLYNRKSKSLERVATNAEPDPMAVPVDSSPDGLVSGAVVCFRNRALLNVPDVRRSPFVKVDSKANVPRSAMFLPLFSHNDVLGVLEVGNARRLGYFTVEEQAAAQHLANQVAASLKLQEQHSVREQLFRSEKLAATGQLISGVASELRAPLESILQLATSLAAYGGRNVPERDLRLLAGESQRASEIVSRLVSFARPEDAAAREVDVNGVVGGLMQFRDPEWKTLGLRVHNRLSAEPVVVHGSQGQIEQVFLNLLVHAEQCASDSPAKTISIASSVIASHMTVEINYSMAEKGPQDSANPFSENYAGENGATGLAVCQGIIHGHGGEIRFGSNAGMARFEVDLPVTRAADPAPAPRVPRHGGALTLMLVDPDQSTQRQMLGLLSARGHRAVPVPAEEAPDLGQRLRFDAIFWAMRPATKRSAEYQEELRGLARCFVLLADAYDADLARSLEETGGALLVRPVKDADLDRVLAELESKAPNASAGRAGK
ncbi:MAG: GAF domain-containing protein [Acidobacteriia bacterium]|nr:GAF domain-containing protein [Terriglobia bacterium]